MSKQFHRLKLSDPIASGNDGSCFLLEEHVWLLASENPGDRGIATRASGLGLREGYLELGCESGLFSSLRAPMAQEAQSRLESVG